MNGAEISALYASNQTCSIRGWQASLPGPTADKLTTRDTRRGEHARTSGLDHRRTSGIGRATAELLHQRGPSAICDRRRCRAKAVILRESTVINEAIASR
jgi:hypothetical protein